MNNKYVIFGAGDYGRAAATAFGQDNVEFYIDNSLDKQRDGLYGVEVLSMAEAVPRICGKKVVVAVPPTYVDEICIQLEKNGVTNYIEAAHLILANRESSSENKLINQRLESAMSWIDNHTIEGRGIAISSMENIIYPEVTGYYIPSLIKFGRKDLALDFARNLIRIQRSDGAWNGPHDNTPYVFDTGQILKGLLAVSSELPSALTSAKAGATWLLSNMQSNGRLITPNDDEWGGDESVCSELIHIYCLSPLVELSKITGRVEYADAANSVLDYYLHTYYERIMNFSHLSHFHAYLMEALLDLGKNDVALEAMKNMERFQKKSGAVPAYNNCDWVCSTGLFQLALVWFRLGNIDRGRRAFDYACGLQNESGGWYGSYLSEENPEEYNSYFPLSEISWANKYFLDALHELRLLESINK